MLLLAAGGTAPGCRLGGLCFRVLSAAPWCSFARGVSSRGGALRWFLIFVLLGPACSFRAALRGSARAGRLRRLSPVSVRGPLGSLWVLLPSCVLLFRLGVASLRGSVCVSLLSLFLFSASVPVLCVRSLLLLATAPLLRGGLSCALCVVSLRGAPAGRSFAAYSGPGVFVAPLGGCLRVFVLC